jgi:hypothetical protein
MQINFNFSGGSKVWWISLLPLGGVALAIFGRGGLLGFGSNFDLFDFTHETGLIIAGIFLLDFGFKELHKKWLIQQTPTSKIRAVAMGISEICGLAKQKFPLKSPITFTDCVYYKFLIEKEGKGSKGQHTWSKINEGRSTNYFYVEDSTGKILVDPLDCEPILSRDYRSIGTDLTGTYRYTEWYLKPDDYVYILGNVRKFMENVDQHKQKLIEALQKLKQDKERLKQFDKDGDGQISETEWDEARNKVEQELIEKELKEPVNTDDDIVIAKGDLEKTFIIADRGEREVARKFSLLSMLATSGGIVLILGMAVSIIARCGLLPASLAIPWHLFYK